MLINAYPFFSFIAPDFLRTEIYNHYDKLLKISNLSFEQLLEAEYHIYKSITFVSEEQVSKESWLFANELVSDIDPKDIVYIAFARQFNCKLWKLWTGDKKLIKGLVQKKYRNILTTNDLILLKSGKYF